MNFHLHVATSIFFARIISEHQNATQILFFYNFMRWNNLKSIFGERASMTMLKLLCMCEMNPHMTQIKSPLFLSILIFSCNFSDTIFRLDLACVEIITIIYGKFKIAVYILKVHFTKHQLQLRTVFRFG
jgi:hypothetical protein